MPEVMAICADPMMSDPSAGDRSASAARFAELLQACQSAPSEVYVAPAAASESSLAPLLDVIDGFEAFAQRPAAAASESASAEVQLSDSDESGDTAEEALDAMSTLNTELLNLQQDIFRFTLTMETLNSAKQGVNTLFQSQG